MRRCKMDYEKKLIEMGYIRFWQKLFYRKNRNGTLLVLNFDNNWKLTESYITTDKITNEFKIYSQSELDDYQIALNILNKDLKELEREN